MTRCRIRDLCRVNPSLPGWDALADDYPVPFLPMERVWTDDLDLSEVRPKSEVASGYTRFAEGDVLLPKITPTFEAGRASVAKGLRGGFGAGTTELHVLRPHAHVDRRWLLHLLNSATFLRRGHFDMYGVAGQKRISDDFVKNYPLDLPDLDAQREVVARLDTEASRIDELIAEQMGLIGLLLERRASELDGWIEHGGSPTDLSEVASPWIDAVPEGWGLMPLKRCVERVMVGIVINPSAYYEADGVPLLRGLNVRPGRVNSDDLVFMSKESNDLHRKSILRSGDVVVVRTGVAGAAALVPAWAVGGNAVDLLIVRPGPRLLPGYLEHLLNSRLVQQQVRYGSVGALQSHFNTSSLANVVVVLPPISEQRRVLDHLRSSLGRYDDLVAEAGTQISLLKEHRHALITAEVERLPGAA